MITEQEFKNHISNGTLTLELYKEWVESGSDIDIQDNDGSTVLIWVSIYGHIEIVKYLLEKGAKINIQNKHGWTALIWASYRGHLEIIQYLVENGIERIMMVK